MKNKMEQIKIEKNAVDQLSVFINSVDNINPQLKEDDKNAIWDGYLVLYDKTKVKPGEKIIKNENIDGRIHTQIKGHFVQKYDKSPKQRVKRTNLLHYRNDGGLFLLVVHMKDYYDFHFYYANLWPMTIDGLLETYKSKDVNVQLTEFSKDDPVEFYCLCKNFLDNSRLQSGNTAKLIKIGMERNKIDGADLIETRVTLPTKDPAGYMLRHVIPFYKKDPHYSIPVYVGEGKAVDVGESLAEAHVIINDRVWYTKIEKNRTNDGVSLKFGDEFIFPLDQNRFRYHPSKWFSHCFKDQKALLEMLENKKVRIVKNDKKLIDFTITPDDGFIQKLKDDIENLEKVDALLKFMDIKQDLDISKMDNLSHENLAKLISSIIENKPLKASLSSPSIVTLQVGNLYIYVLAIPNPDGGSWRVENFFGPNNLECRTDIGEGEGLQPVSRFTWLHANDIIQASNINWEVIMKSVEETPWSKTYSNGLVNLVLQTIGAYDLCPESNEKLLDHALSLVEIQIKNEGLNPISIINKYQIIKRLREFTYDELAFLLERKNIETEPRFIWGYNVLLDCGYETDISFQMIDEEERSNLIDLPIYHLWERYKKK